VNGGFPALHFQLCDHDGLNLCGVGRSSIPSFQPPPFRAYPVQKAQRGNGVQCRLSGIADGDLLRAPNEVAQIRGALGRRIEPDGPRNSNEQVLLAWLSYGCFRKPTTAPAWRLIARLWVTPIHSGHRSHATSAPSADGMEQLVRFFR